MLTRVPVLCCAPQVAYLKDQSLKSLTQTATDSPKAAPSAAHQKITERKQAQMAGCIWPAGSREESLFIVFVEIDLDDSGEIEASC